MDLLNPTNIDPPSSTPAPAADGGQGAGARRPSRLLSITPAPSPAHTPKQKSIKLQPKRGRGAVKRGRTRRAERGPSRDSELQEKTMSFSSSSEDGNVTLHIEYCTANAACTL